jgi:hypothetical protein
MYARNFPFCAHFDIFFLSYTMPQISIKISDFQPFALRLRLSQSLRLNCFRFLKQRIKYLSEQWAQNSLPHLQIHTNSQQNIYT